MSFEERLERRPFRTLLIFGLGAIGLVGILGSASWALNLASQPGRVLTKTFDADNMIHNYEWFHQQVQDANAAADRIAIAQNELETFLSSAGDRSTWTRDDKQEFSRLSSNVSGARGFRAKIVADYNAAASMANKSIFRADTPETLQ